MRLFPFLPEFAHFPRDFGRHIGFLRQILILSLTSFGGPQAHLALIIETLVKRRKYLSEEELLELFGLCQMLPGPTSTQTITAIGHKRGGPWLAFFTLIIWLGPACTIMGALAFLMAYSGSINLNIAFLSVLAPVSVGFLLSAGIKLTRTVINSTLKWVIMLLTAVISVILRNPFVFPALLILGGFISFQALPKEEIKSKAAIIPAWRNLYIFIGILIFSAVLGQVTKERAVLLFENTYRYGSLVFGGGQVLIPMMFDQYVRYKGYLTSQEILTG